MGGERKAYPLRVDPALWAAVERCAAADLRSVNAQVECLLREALKARGVKLKAPAPRQARPAAKGEETMSDGPEWFAPKRYGYGAGLADQLAGLGADLLAFWPDALALSDRLQAIGRLSAIAVMVPAFGRLHRRSCAQHHARRLALALGRRGMKCFMMHGGCAAAALRQ